ncbi:TIGR03086 family metal-binding protein [Streptomyces sp. TP-A0874]|uniref:TIGR03086 family metal-binding protein n=1 Tax=Streptomyces sp. TP-A0874 TaxID=549819 RepID=UPI000B2C86DF|nr:TIGR03086 family metal-binding protein [Streptomyces sp. TP-A0874]
MVDLLDAFDASWAEFDHRVHRVGQDQWQDATPCEAWTVRDLVGHLVREHLWAPWLLRGATLEEVGGRFDGDLLDDDPVVAWERAAARSQAAFHRPEALDGVVHTSAGPSPTTEYGWQMTTDLTVHAWDLDRGIEGGEPLDDELTATVYEQVAPQAAEWRASGLFDEPVPVPESASAEDRLVALLGRQP